MTKTGWQRYFEGWQVGLVLLAAAALSALLSTPLTIPPDHLPLPRVDRQEQRRVLHEDRTLARHALKALPPSVRQVGEGVRRLGAQSAQDSNTRRALLKQLKRLTHEARRRHGDKPLLQLRALQGHLLLAASRHLTAQPGTQAHLDELLQLGGQLVANGRLRGWFDASGFLGDERDLVDLFKVHWGQITGLSRNHPFSPSLNQWRNHYRFLLSQPGPTGADPTQETKLKLKYIAELRRHDSDYPSLLAKGILLRRAGNLKAAAANFRGQLQLHPNGPRSILTWNHLVSCL